MKEKVLKVFMLTMCFVLIMSFSTGCIFSSRVPKVKEDGFFQYIIVGKNGPFPITQEKEVIAIVGFTASGKK